MYYAYEVLGEAWCWNVAVMSLDWTRDHLWDSTYEGIFLEIDRDGTTPMWDGVKNDWVQGGAMVAFAYVTEVRPPAVPEFSFSPIIIASLTATLYLTLKKYSAKRKFIYVYH
ncbi:MAG: PEF-CTERM sorting domain-containing protein [Candidatus Bathyarchaeia archaeon]